MSEMGFKVQDTDLNRFFGVNNLPLDADFISLQLFANLILNLIKLLGQICTRRSKKEASIS